MVTILKVGASKLLTFAFDENEILKKRLLCERFEQLTVDMLPGVR